MKLVLDSWQQEILDCKDKYILLCKGRQIGGTTIMARKCAERMVSQKECHIVVASLTEDQAQLVIAMALGFLEENHKSWIKKPYSRNVTKSIINLNNGSQIISRPVGTTGNAVRGFTGHVLYLNEASRMPEFIFEAAKPILLTTAGDIWMDSTPFGKKGYFYKSYLNKNKRFKVFYHTSEEVIENRKISKSWTKEQKQESLRFLKEEREDMTKLQYAQEYLGKFIEEIMQLFPDDLIKECQTLKRRETIKQGNYYLGVDIGGEGENPSTFEVLDYIKNSRLEQVENLEIGRDKKMRTTDTTNQVIFMNNQYKFKKEFIDSGGLGIGVVDQLRLMNEHKRKVFEINNATRYKDYKYSEKPRKEKLMKEALYLNLQRLMERGEIKLLDDFQIFNSLKSIQKEYVDDKTGKRKLKIYGRDTHIAEGLIRAAWCVEAKGLKLFCA